jgi:hypothetical protein
MVTRAAAMAESSGRLVFGVPAWADPWATTQRTGIPAFAQNLNLFGNIKTAAAIVSCSARGRGGRSSSAEAIR